MSAEGTARAVKPWSSFQCTGIHHAVRAPTYKGDEHLAYALNESTVPLPFLPFACMFVLQAVLLFSEPADLPVSMHFESAGRSDANFFYYNT